MLPTSRHDFFNESIQKDQGKFCLRNPPSSCYAATMKTFSLLILIPLVIYAWAAANPVHARSIFAGLKRNWRRYLVRRKGKAAAAKLAHSFREQAQSQGFEREQIDEVISEQWTELVERLGSKEANDSLGEPTPLERYF